MTSPAEVLLIVAVLGLALVVLARVTRSFVFPVILLVVTSGAVGLLLRPSASASLPPERPRGGTVPAYVGSSACRACHPSEHASFSRTFHRTMTQDATRKTVLAPLDGRVLSRRGEEVWANDRRDGSIDDAPVSARRVVLTTGSHREQAYWIRGERMGELRLVPFVWLVREQRFVARHDAFLVPPDAEMPNVRWNSNCIACHAVAGEPRHLDEHDVFDTRVAELGIACEACHGPGAEHASKYRDPIARYAQHASKAADPTIVHPKRLAPERSVAVCGQCHSYAYPKDESEWWTSGYAKTFRAGDRLDDSRIVLAPDAGKNAPAIDAPMESLFWPDGTIRVGGREYNGLVVSACHARGEGEKKITCLSCHAMHKGDPAGQIDPDHAGDRGCTSCHATMSATHTHHAVGSPGRACVACHMPKTSYALFSAVRSHRIDQPRADSSKPNACNLCHLDQSLAWTAKYLAEWFGQKPFEGDGQKAFEGDGQKAFDRDGQKAFDRDALGRDSRSSVAPAGAVFALAGDAAVRVVVADALGSREAQAATKKPGLHVSLLAELMTDPYAAVRFVAARSLDAFPEYGDRLYAFDAPPENRVAARERALSRVQALAPQQALDQDLVDRLLKARDHRRITIAE